MYSIYLKLVICTLVGGDAQIWIEAVVGIQYRPGGVRVKMMTAPYFTWKTRNTLFEDTFLIFC